MDVGNTTARRDWLPLPWTEPLTEAEATALLVMRRDLARHRERLDEARAKLAAALRSPRRESKATKARQARLAEQAKTLDAGKLTLWATTLRDGVLDFWARLDAATQTVAGAFADVPNEEELAALRRYLFLHADVREAFPEPLRTLPLPLQVELFLHAAALWAQDVRRPYRALLYSLALLLECCDELERRRLPKRPEYAPEIMAEGLGSRLMRLYDGTITPKERNELLKAAWPKADGKRWYLPGGGGHYDRVALQQTRAWMFQQVVERYIPKQIRECGSLEAAVRDKRGRGLPQWMRWRFQDAFRKLDAGGKRDNERIRLVAAELYDDSGDNWLYTSDDPEVQRSLDKHRQSLRAARAVERLDQECSETWDRAHDADPPLSKREEAVLGYVLDGLSNRKVAVAMGWSRKSEGVVRRTVNALVKRRILRAKWKRHRTARDL